MTVDISKLTELKNEIEKKEKKRDKLDKKIFELIDKLQDACMHPTVNTKDYYCSGGYDYLSSVTITETCAVCNKVLKSYDDPNHKGYHG
jgi:vesicle coat complex subunit